MTDRNARKDRKNQGNGAATGERDQRLSGAGAGGAETGISDAGIRSTDLRDSEMMAHLLDALEDGADIGHYGRLVFTMVARHFMDDDEIVALLAKQPEMDEEAARAHLMQVKARGYNPPKRSRILAWQSQQDFPICPNPEDPNACNVYRDLEFPPEVYERIDEFWEEKVEAQEE